jgi:hypothetical protein
VVLAELTGYVAEGFQELGDCRVLGPQTEVGARHAHFAEPGPETILSGDEGRTACGAALFAVGVGEAHAFVGEAVDVGGAVAHQPVAVAAQVGDADVISPDDQNVRSLFRHIRVLSHGFHTATVQSPFGALLA